MDQYSQQYFDARNEFHGHSKALFKTQQDYLKKLQDLKEYKIQVKQQKKDYVENMTQLALRAANITYMKETFDQEESYWQRQIHHQEGVVKEKREILEKTLQEYRQIRNEIAMYQTKVADQLDKKRNNTLNSISFVNYTKALIEKEMKNTSSIDYSLPSSTGKNYLANRKLLQRLQKNMYGKLSKVREHTKEYYLNKISEFRQQERILFGRTRELIEQTIDHANHAAHNNNGLNILSSQHPGTTALLANQEQFLNEDDDQYSPNARQQEHYLENWIINKICAKDMGDDTHGEGKGDDNGLAGNSYFDDDDDDLPNGSLSMMSSIGDNESSRQRRRSGVMPPAGSTPGSSQSGRIRRHSLVQQGDMVQFLERMKSRTPSSTTGTNTGSIGGGRGAPPHITPMGSTGGTHQRILAAPGVEMQPRIFTATMQGTSLAVHINGSTYATTPTAPTTTTTTATTSRPMMHQHHQSGSTKSEEEQNVIYDPNEFLPACSGDYLRPYCIMEMQKGIQDREERLSKLALLTAKAKGKVKQLSCIKEGLDQEILRQGCLLLMVLDLLETQTQQSPFLNTSTGMPASPTNRKTFAGSNIKSTQVEEMKKFLKSSMTSLNMHHQAILKTKDRQELHEGLNQLLKFHSSL